MSPKTMRWMKNKMTPSGIGTGELNMRNKVMHKNGNAATIKSKGVVRTITALLHAINEMLQRERIPQGTLRTSTRQATRNACVTQVCFERTSKGKNHPVQLKSTTRISSGNLLW